MVTTTHPSKLNPRRPTPQNQNTTSILNVLLEGDEFCFDLVDGPFLFRAHGEGLGGAGGDNEGLCGRRGIEKQGEGRGALAS